MVAQPNAALALINQQIMWNRLIAVVEEQAQTMLRTAFSTPVREAGDLSAGVFDRQGRMLAQAVTGTPGHVNSMANAVRHFLDVYPLVGMKPGDHFITNDPWLTSGHLHDITVVSPSFYRGEAVGLFANTIHVVDIGGLGMGPDGRQVFEEGLAIPIMSLAREGRMNEDLLHLVRANVREPLQVVGDIYACAACNDEGSRRLIEMMDEFEIANLDRLGETIVDASRDATLARIRALPHGTYRNSLTMDGYDKPLVLNAALTISEEGIHVDFDGTSPASSYGINVVYNYCLAYTAFGVKCLVAPDVPNNAGSLAPITVSAPEGCVLNVKRPWPVAARHTVGHMLPDVVFGCLHQVVTGGVPAEGASSLWNPADFWRRLAGRRGRRGNRRKCAAGVQHRDLPLRRRWRSADPGRAQRHGLSIGRAHDTRWKQPRAWHRFCSIVASFGRAPAAPANSAAALVSSSSLAVPEPLRSRCCAISSVCATRRGDATAAGPVHRARWRCAQAVASGQKGGRPCLRATRYVWHCRVAAASAIHMRAIRSASSTTCSTG